MQAKFGGCNERLPKLPKCWPFYCGLSKPKARPLPKNSSAEHLETHRSRVRTNHFVLVTKSLCKAEDVQEADAAVEGTRSIRALSVDPKKPGHVQFKDLLCPCTVCRHESSEGECEFADMTEPWRHAQIAATEVASRRAAHSHAQQATEQDADDAASESSDEDCSLPALKGGMNVAVLKHADDDCKYYIAALADDFEVTVPVGETITCEAIFDENHEPLEFPEGTKVLKGYLWSRRNTAQRKYEL